ncbi:conjugal transfer relaxosome DNA-binding protein TraM [Klebsiella michiganensis]|uniref:conjugal transfer relaxosome DNA-binding protein TraM n=1 Tax=Klebsiella michiganensis TaxID=1134687 RepID=UPI001008B899|nr:conjugal transfer relaxosome DNA-binding protein TraM [Klebsiella michiganensis]MBE0137451.1 relaxosome protein TraM [Klebsiella michiganensis]MBE0204588.1 relaxosome protein TraM [Klebsiella michiganensis]MBZ7440057.1 relaxosome protein TraM [Klebsiella michiganensis]MDV0363507.1 conjugal transfer relaxosome DNA-binding protein TraM [Klebsiella michiganensis]RXI15828.1 conjugal transfer protein TraM [Klebsiella michiganensis]
MARVQAYASDEVAEKINAIVEKRKAEGAKDKDVSFSSVASMLLELGLRVYEAQMERKESGFNQAEFNKMLLENVIKTQFSISKVLAMESLSPHIQGDERFDFKSMVMNIRDDAKEVVERFFPETDDEES